MKKNKTKQKIFTLIPSGKFKGKKFLLPSLATTRTTKSIVKECVFNVLQNKLKDKVFIELFGGSGLMGALALSHYALKVFIIEKDAKAYEIAKENIKTLNDENIFIIKADSFIVIEKLLQSLKNEKCVLYLDPPFECRQNYKDIYENITKLIIKLEQENIAYIIIEHHSLIEFDKYLGSFMQTKMKKFGKTSLSFYEKNHKI